MGGDAVRSYVNLGLGGRRHGGLGGLTGLGNAIKTGFEAAGEFAEKLVPSREGDDPEEGHDEGEGASDVPPTEDETEVFSGPGEEHLGRWLLEYAPSFESHYWECLDVDTHVH